MKTSELETGVVYGYGVYGHGRPRPCVLVERRLWTTRDRHNETTAWAAYDPAARRPQRAAGRRRLLG